MIRWYGKSTNGVMKWKFEVESLGELYNILVDKGIISVVDYDPFEKYVVERSGFSYSEIESLACCLADEEMSGDYGAAFERVMKEKGISDSMTDKDYFLLISGEDGNAYYQTFENPDGTSITFDKNGMIK